MVGRYRTRLLPYRTTVPVYENCVEQVLVILRAGRVLILHVGQEVQHLGELAAVVELDGGVRDGVVLEPHEVEVQHGRELLKDDSLLRVLEKVESEKKNLVPDPGDKYSTYMRIRNCNTGHQLV